MPTKSGLMLGLGERTDETLGVMHDLRARQVDILTLGQYLRPSPKHLPVVRYVPPEEFADLRRAGQEMGFAHVEAGPLVRSSYHADSAAAHASC
jgi:lipoic acid synthetase